MSARRFSNPITLRRVYRVDLIHRILDRDATLTLQAPDAARARRSAVRMMAAPADWLPVRAAMVKAAGDAS